MAKKTVVLMPDTMKILGILGEQIQFGIARTDLIIFYKNLT